MIGEAKQTGGLSPGSAMDRPLEGGARKRRRRLLTGVAAGLALLIALVAAAALSGGEQKVNRRDLQIAPVIEAPFLDYVPVRAQAAPLHTTFFGASEGGQVERVLVKDGVQVTAGLPLAVLANPQLKLEVTSREADISGRLGDVSGRQIALLQAKSNLEREVAEANYRFIDANRQLQIRRSLHAKGFVSDVGLRTIADEVAYHETRLASLQRGQVRERELAAEQAARMAEMAQRLRNNLKVVEASLDALTIRAPAAGRLTNFALEPGQFVKAGDQLGQVDSAGGAKLIASIDEFYIARVAVGQSATGQLPDGAARLRVERVLPQVANGAFRAELVFVGPAPVLRRGQSVETRITLGASRRAVVAPNGPWLEAGGNIAFVVDRSGRRAERRAVSIGRRNPEQVEILNGLAPGDTLVTSSYEAFGKASHLRLR